MRSPNCVSAGFMVSLKVLLIFLQAAYSKLYDELPGKAASEIWLKYGLRGTDKRHPAKA